ncbi:MAG: aminoglycoside phosphotransferase family protein [Caldilineales bacterium]
MTKTLDIWQVEAFLADRYGAEVSALTSVGRGEWSQAFAFDHQGRGYVVRFGAHRDDFERDRFAARFAGPALPVPQVVDLGEALGGYYAISERMPGGYIDMADEAQMRALLPALFAMLDAMRSADLSQTRGYGGVDGAGNAWCSTWQEMLLSVAEDSPEDRTGGWRARLATSAVGSEPFDLAYARLEALAGDLPAARHLIHNDLLHFNVLVQGDRISGVLDWGCAMAGDFLYDLALISFWQPWYPAWQRIDFVAEARRHYAAIGLDVPGFDQRLRCCQLHIGLAGMAYQAYAGHWDDLEATARRTLAIAD